ncbi:MAG: hypothetical protein ABEI86_02975 [Halobacteriaceae archaeon]
MAFSDKLVEWGWGALFLFSYFLAISFLLRPDLSRPIILALASIPTVVIVFLTVSLNDSLMELLAGDTIDSAFTEIDNKTGEEEFYWDQNAEIRETIDELDRKAHQKVVMIVAGLLISITSPVPIYLEFGLQGFVGGSVLSALVIYLLVYKPYFDLQQVIKSSAKIYDANDEN